MGEKKIGYKRILDSLFGETVREVINKANSIGLQKEDIVQIFEVNSQVYLLYYK
jgi:hypothetical protein